MEPVAYNASGAALPDKIHRKNGVCIDRRVIRFTLENSMSLVGPVTRPRGDPEGSIVSKWMGNRSEAIALAKRRVGGTGGAGEDPARLQ